MTTCPRIILHFQEERPSGTEHVETLNLLRSRSSTTEKEQISDIWFRPVHLNRRHQQITFGVKFVERFWYMYSRIKAFALKRFKSICSCSISLHLSDLAKVTMIYHICWWHNLMFSFDSLMFWRILTKRFIVFHWMKTKVTTLMFCSPILIIESSVFLVWPLLRITKLVRRMWCGSRNFFKPDISQKISHGPWWNK